MLRPVQQPPGIPLSSICVDLTLVSPGARKQLGSFEPRAISLHADAPIEAKDVLPGLMLQRFKGDIFFGPPGLLREQHAITLDTAQYSDTVFYRRLQVDKSDEGVTWNVKGTQESGAFPISHLGRTFHFKAYRFLDDNPPLLHYYSDYALEGRLPIQIDGQDRLVRFLIADDVNDRGNWTSGNLEIGFDANHNGRLDGNELLQAFQSVTFDGRTYTLDFVDALGTQAIFREVLDGSADTVFRYLPKVGATMPPIKGDVIRGAHQGNVIDVRQDFKNQIVLVDFWATWCGPCLGALPALAKARETFSARGFEIVGVAVDSLPGDDAGFKSKELVLNTLTTREERTGQRFAWPILHDYGVSIIGKWGDLAENRQLPQYFLIDGDTGRILATSEEIGHISDLPEGKWMNLIEQFLKDKGH